MMRQLWSLPSSSTSKIWDQKMKVVSTGKIMMSRSIELSDANPPKPLPSVPVVGVLPPIAYHRGTEDSCSGFGVC
jgi:hypothetical protein